jgi:hypothetical protein
MGGGGWIGITCGVRLGARPPARTRVTHEARRRVTHQMRQGMTRLGMVHQGPA